MRVLVVGSGGREHALAWKVAQSPRLGRLFVAPGNAGTAALAENVSLAADDVPGLTAWAARHGIDLVIVGPEAALAAGLADALRAAGVPVFGPTRAAAEIEASKAFAKDFMARHGLPTAAYGIFTDFYAAIGYLLGVDFEQGGVVIKASGLAAGKGVMVPTCADDAEAAVREIMLDHAFGAAGDVVIIEERLSGEEISLLAFSDGVTVKPMLPAQDHKRIGDNDTGPNTGGMGAYAPAPACPPELVAALTRDILQPAISGLAAEGRPFVGVLYAGFMLTPTGPKLLEFNCRFGDPETQALLPLLDSDLLEVALACTQGRLAEVDVRWKAGAAACVVLAAPGYPGAYPSGAPISGLAGPFDQAVVFHAGTRLANDQVITAGGRVLGVTGWDADLPAALRRAYAAVECIHFSGAQFRRDIGGRALRRLEAR
ncbi:MAG: phosphoribosylamine--glycine ligase [Anaerolineales bacterium]|nr:phosphoribosylamine--glycine ligase [Anaerolineales bacterium]